VPSNLPCAVRPAVTMTASFIPFHCLHQIVFVFFFWRKQSDVNLKHFPKVEEQKMR
jgi:hypothetical protein